MHDPDASHQLAHMLPCAPWRGTLHHLTAQWHFVLKREVGCLVKTIIEVLGLQTQEGYPLVSDTGSNKPTKRVHVFGEQWKLQGEGYEAVWFTGPK